MKDLSPLEGMPLKELNMARTSVTDISPLEGMPLESIEFTPTNITQGLDTLRDMKSLKIIGTGNVGQRWPAVEFWERHDNGAFE